MGATAEDLARRAADGDGDAQVALGQLADAEDKVATARAWFARSAKQGNLAGLRLLAINLLTRPPIVAADGVNMIRSAAHKGDPEAAYVCGMLAAQDYRLEDRWAVARECLERAAERGWEPAREQLSFLGRIGALENSADSIAPAQFSEMRQSPCIAIAERFVSDEICDWFIGRARPHIGRALVYDETSGEGRIEQARTNSSIAFNLVQSDLALMLLRARIAATTRLAPEGLEATAVLHYAPQQEFEPHVDFLDPSVPAYAADLRTAGQRVVTFLLYLNEDYEGGETDFPAIGFRYKGRKGDALIFWNVTPEGRIDQRTRHAGLPPASGEKWLLSQWIRQPPA